MNGIEGEDVYKRQPVYRAYGLKNRSALIRVPAARGKATRIEYRAPDPACNPCLLYTSRCV